MLHLVVCAAWSQNPELVRPRKADSFKRQIQAFDGAAAALSDRLSGCMAMARARASYNVVSTSGTARLPFDPRALRSSERSGSSSSNSTTTEEAAPTTNEASGSAATRQ